MTHIYGIDAESLQFIHQARQIASEVAAPHSDEVDVQGRFPKETIDALRDAGLTGLHIAREAEGLEQGPRVFAGVVEEIATACGSSAMVYVMHVAATQAIAASTTVGNKTELLKRIAGGKHLSTLAWSERGSRSQFWAPVSKLLKNGTGYTTSAMKSWVTSADHADSYVSSGQMPGAESPMQSTLYLVERTADGVRRSGTFDGLGLRGNDSAPVEFDNLHVSNDRLLTGHGEGPPMMLEVVLPWFSVGTSAMAHGLCIAAIDATTKHLNGGTLEISNSKLRDLPNLRARLAEMSMKTDQSRALLGFTLSQLAAPDEMTPLYVLKTRMSALTTAVEVTDLAMKTCGGAAFSKHLGLERVFRDARAGWVMAPTVDHLQDFVGRALVGLPLF